MPSADHGHIVCAARPLPVFDEQRTFQEQLRAELPIIARLSEDALRRHGRHHPDLFPRLHFAVCRLRDAVLTHFDNEQALLLPSVRLLEDGAPDTGLDLSRLVPELTAEHLHIMNVLTAIGTITHEYRVPATSPLLSMLVSTLRRIDRDLHRHFDLEQRELFPHAVELQGALSRPSPAV
jgi:iron-sulfur cluster repair protein YtfE (RIC family)